VAKDGCEACHTVGSWREITFDHARTGYPLSGGHARVACAPCHLQKGGAGSPAGLRFAGLQKSCESCHRDPHQGQFARAGAGTSCDRCHTTSDLKAARFDHARDAAWAHDGAHARVACTPSHRPETRGGATFVRYKPLPKTCRGCHAGSPQTANGEPR
jgi:hypothetical protein